jgi:AcrR family transcriptional regulator
MTLGQEGGMDPKELREQAIKDAKCGLILNAARKVFDKKGYWDARLEDIAAEVGFSKASLYNYYPDKETLFLSLAIREYGTLLERIENEAGQERPFLAAVEAILRIIFSVFQEHSAFFINISNFQNMAALHRDMAKHPEIFRELHELFQKTVYTISAVMERGKAGNEITSPLEPVTLAFFIVSLIQSVHMSSLRTGRTLETDIAIGRIMDFIKHGAGVTAA